MKIGIATLYYQNFNYGGQIQALAMQKILEGEGHEAKLIAYRQDTVKYFRQRLADLGPADSAARIFRKIIFRFLRMRPAVGRAFLLREKRFLTFMKKIPHTDTVYTERNIGLCDRYFDCYVCGSDQIWNPSWWNDFLLLNFTRKPRFAYGASIARISLTESQKRCLSESTREFAGVSVRENQAKVLLEEFLCRKVEWVLDPVFLVPAAKWRRLAVKPAIGQPYILIYNLGNSTGLLREICRRARREGFYIVSVGFGHNTYFRSRGADVDEEILDAGPREWMGLIAGASCVFTDSFHGTAFSLLFQKNFWCFEKDRERKNHENSRLYSILKICGAEERLLRPGALLDKALFRAPLDYAAVEERMEERRRTSMAYIRKCLREVEHEQGKKSPD